MASSGGVFDVAQLNTRYSELLEQSNQPEFWSKPETAQAVAREQDEIKAKLDGLERLRGHLEEARLFLAMAEESGADDSEEARETEKALEKARAEIEDRELKVMLGWRVRSAWRDCFDPSRGGRYRGPGLGGDPAAAVPAMGRAARLQS